ncbi:hypothetical protein LCGC14_2647390, partial [marine sediment metagenome]
THPAQTQTAPPAGAKVTIVLSKPAEAPPPPAILALAGTALTTAIVGKPKASWTWQLGYQGTVVEQNSLQLNAKGTGQFEIVLPKVRVRAECELVLLRGKRKIRRRLVIFPSAKLAQCAKLIEDLELGVVDERGRIQEALRAEKAAFEDLSTQLLQDSFEGGIVLLAGFEKPELLGEACKRLQGRIEKGMFALILNPPAKWKAWGVSRQQLSAPLSAPVAFAKDIGQAILPTDLGLGPRPFVLRSEKPYRMLAWVEKVGKDDDGKPHRVKCPLIVVRRVGEGRVIVGLMPQVDHPLKDAAGRAILDELVLWVIKECHGKQSGKEQENDQ